MDRRWCMAENSSAARQAGSCTIWPGSEGAWPIPSARWCKVAGDLDRTEVCVDWLPARAVRGSVPDLGGAKFLLRKSIQISVETLEAEDGAANELRDLGEDGVSEGAGPVHPVGNPIIASNSKGLG
jgi:hypothetical protein